VLRPGGVFVSSIDLRDHFHTERHLHAEHLRYPAWLWNAMTWNRSVFTSRLRWSDWRQLLHEQEFELQLCEPEQCEVLTGVYGRHPARHRFTLDQFAVVGLFFVARKPSPRPRA
jgi:hypothetical protein